MPTNEINKTIKTSSKRINFIAWVETLFLVIVSALISFAVMSFTSSKEIKLSYIIKDIVGETILKDNNIKVTQVYYATEDNPTLSEQLKKTMTTVLSDNKAIINQEHTVLLPGNTIKIRVDVALTDDTEIEQEKTPDVVIKVNNNEIKSGINKSILNHQNKLVSNYFMYEINKEVLSSSINNNRTNLKTIIYSFSIQSSFVLFFLVFTLVSIIFRLIKSYPRFIQVAIFFLISIIPVTKFNLEKESKQENRNLEVFPSSFSLNNPSLYFSQIERWFNDRFFGRDFLIALSDNIKTFFDDRGSERVLRGEDDWLFYKNTLPETKNINTEFNTDRAGEYLNMLFKYAAAKGKKFVYVICPDKFRIYGDKSKYYSPDFFLKDDITDQFVEDLRNNYSFPVIYQRKELLQKRLELSHDIYFKYDTHWTKEGAYYGYYLPVVHEVSVAPITIDRWESEEMQNGDLIAMLYSNESKKKKLAPQKYYYPVFKKYASIEEIQDTHNTTRNIIKATNPNGVSKNILIFRDSFSTATVDLFANTFQQSIFIWRNEIFPSDIDYIDQSDIIVLEQVERFIFSLSSLKFAIGE